MHILKRIIPMLAAGSLVGVVASQALAGSCATDIRPFTALTGFTDIVNMSCKHKGGVTATALLSAQDQGSANRAINANLTAGTNDGFSAAIVQGLDNSGNVINGCQVVDTTPGNGAPSAVKCNAAVKWKGFVQFKE